MPVNQKDYENKIIDITYEAAEKIYDVYAKSAEYLRFEKDDFLQDAVMHIISKYGNNIKTEEDFKNFKKGLSPQLRTFFKNKLQSQYAKTKMNKEKQIITKTKHGEEAPDYLEYLDDDSKKIKSPENLNNANPSEIEEMLEGKEILKDLINLFSKTPYKTNKHTYIGQSKALNKNIELSEYNIAKLLINGETLMDILKIYNSYTTNIGTSSKASFINRKVKKVINMLTDAINSLPEYENKIVKAYIGSIQ
jgi:hypothetical protein